MPEREYELRKFISDEIRNQLNASGRKLINDEITARLSRIGIYEQDDEHLEITRANFVKLNKDRISSENRSHAFSNILVTMVTSRVGQVLWMVFIISVYLTGHATYKELLTQISNILKQ